MISNEYVIISFNRIFSLHPELISSAPGRVNLIGEHTDYNGGFVLPAAINREIRIAARTRHDRILRLYSESFAEMFETSLATGIIPSGKKGWQDYFLAVVDGFTKRRVDVPGMDIYICGDIPQGAGLSSSAAYEVCATILLNAVCNAGLSPCEIAILAQAAEHSPFVGVRCGIMDQLISVMAQADHALLIDCHTLETMPVPFDSSRAKIVLINSMKRRGLVDSEYNRRRAECEDGLRLMRKLSGKEFPTIRHIPADVFERFQGSLPENYRRRIRHNLTENERVHHFSKCLSGGDLETAGRLLYASHESLRTDFEVSCAELDCIVQIASRCEGVYGCRMTGAGFGGCAVALVEPTHVEDFLRVMSAEYEKSFSILPEIHVTSPSAGATAMVAR